MRTTTTLRLRGRDVVLGPRTWVMGILNVTPDSFSDGGLYAEPGAAVRRGLEMVADGVDILDIGGESTRPGAEPVPSREELDRVVPVIESLRRDTNVYISIDTSKAAVARAALDAGADMINDISALRFDPALADLAAERRAAVVLMHMLGTPRTMQEAPAYRDLLGEIGAFLSERLAAAAAAGIPREAAVVDPGVGFGKTGEHNLDLIQGLPAFAVLGRPILMGVSRKAFIGRILDLPAGERLEGTLAAAVLCASRGAHILRVHDVRAVHRAAAIADAVMARAPLAPPPLPEDGRHAC